MLRLLIIHYFQYSTSSSVFFFSRMMGGEFTMYDFSDNKNQDTKATGTVRQQWRVGSRLNVTAAMHPNSHWVEIGKAYIKR